MKIKSKIIIGSTVVGIIAFFVFAFWCCPGETAISIFMSVTTVALVMAAR